MYNYYYSACKDSDMLWLHKVAIIRVGKTNLESLPARV